MTPAAAMAASEEGAVWADLALASTPEALWRRLDRSPLIEELRQDLMGNAPGARRLLDRAVDLFRSPVASGCRHPADYALCAYLFALGVVAGEDVGSFVDEVAEAARQELPAATFIARRVAAARHPLAVRDSIQRGIADYAEPDTTEQGSDGQPIRRPAGRAGKPA